MQKCRDKLKMQGTCIKTGFLWHKNSYNRCSLSAHGQLLNICWIWAVFCPCSAQFNVQNILLSCSFTSIGFLFKFWYDTIKMNASDLVYLNLFCIIELVSGFKLSCSFSVQLFLTEYFLTEFHFHHDFCSTKFSFNKNRLESQKTQSLWSIKWYLILSSLTLCCNCCECF